LSSNVFRFKVGEFACLAILDDRCSYPPEIFFSNVPRDRLRPLLAGYGKDEEVEMCYICLFIHAGPHRVLVDTGMGPPGFRPAGGKLLEHLRGEGIEPDQIDTVILSHGHPDHIGGNLDEGGKPAFPNARYVMYEKEWEYWMSDPDLAELSLDPHFKEGILASARKNLSGIRGQIDLVRDADTEILPGIVAIATAGHSPGHMSLEILSNGERLLFLGDVFIHPIHIEDPEAIALVDHLPEAAITTRRRLFEKAVEEECLVMGPHFPFPGLGHIVRTAPWWQPVPKQGQVFGIPG
jgi:glyoxylase-like metal-dependent hydrolase (beta-lactamase superfamily II)